MNIVILFIAELWLRSELSGIPQSGCSVVESSWQQQGQCIQDASLHDTNQDVHEEAQTIHFGYWKIEVKFLIIDQEMVIDKVFENRIFLYPILKYDHFLHLEFERFQICRTATLRFGSVLWR